MVVKDELIRRRVLFIGTAVPLEIAEGLEAVQQPLKQRYPVDDDDKIEGILSYLTVLPSGLQVEYIDGSQRPILFPITSLNLCAAVRCVTVVNNTTKEKQSKFISLSNPAASGSKRPAIFSAITRRTTGKKVLECHGFICESDKDALDLVAATSAADRMSKHKMNGSTLPASFHSDIHANTLKSSTNGHANGEAYPMRLVTGERRHSAAPEFYTSPPQHGYFYKSSTTPIKKYTMEKMASDTEAERLRATSPPPLSARSMDRRSVYSMTPSRNGPPPPVLHTLPRPAPNMIPVRTVPVPVRPRFFSPPPTLLRPRIVSKLKEPYMVVPPPAMYFDGPPPPLIRGPGRRRGSASSGSHSHSPDNGSSRSSSPEHTSRRMANGDGDASSEVSSRPRTPPTDYDKKKPNRHRISRREQYEMRQPNFYHPAAMRNGEVFPPVSPYEYYPYPTRGPQLIYLERSRSVPPPVEMARTLEKKKGKKNRKGKKSKAKGAPSDISTDSIGGYASEVPNGMLDRSNPAIPRDFRRFEKQFKHERAFSRSLMEEKRYVPSQDNQSGAYALNELMASKGRHPDAEPFAMY